MSETILRQEIAREIEQLLRIIFNDLDRAKPLRKPELHALYADPGAFSASDFDSPVAIRFKRACRFGHPGSATARTAQTDFALR